MSKIQLRPYQKRDVTYMVEKRRAINANEPGLGKTLECLCAIDKLGHKGTLIISPKIATGVWQQEARQWFDWDSAVSLGTPKERKEAQKKFFTTDVPILITNFALIKEIVDLEVRWETIIIDEAHLGGLLNRNSKTFELIKKLESRNLFILTGTPVRRGPQDLWSLLNLLDRKKFNSYWAFVNKHCHVIDGVFGKEILGRPKNVKSFMQMLNNHMVRNLKKDVLHDLPEKQRVPWILELTKKQKSAYDEIVEDMMLTQGEDILLTPSVLARDLRLRQLMVCPRLLGVNDNGAAIEALVEMVEMQFDVNRSVVVSTAFRQAVPYIREALERAIEDIYIEEIHGGVKESSVSVANRFQAHKSHRKVLIYTIKSGASWTAHAASTGFVLGAEWDVNDNVQAEDRIHRFGQKESVLWYYFVHKGTKDDDVVNTLNEKADAQYWTLHGEEALEKQEQIRQENLKKY